MPKVNIPGVGTVNFPDTMKPEEITKAIETDILPNAKAAPKAEAEPSVLEKAAKTILTPVAKVAEFADRFTGAPIRAGLNEMQNREAARGELPNAPQRLGRFLPGQVGNRVPGANPIQDLKDLAAGGMVAARNIGAKPGTVPEMKDIAARSGVSTTPLSAVAPGLYSETGEGAPLKKGGFFDPSQAGATGFVGDLLTPMPGVAELAALGKVAKTGAKVGAHVAAEGGAKAVRGAAKTVDVLTGTEAATKTLDATKDALKATADATKKLGTGIAKKYEGKYNPKYTEKHLKTIEANGIDPALIPNSVKFGENSQASKYQRYEAEFLRPELADAHDAGLKQVQDATRKEIEKIGASAPGVNQKVPGRIKIPQDAAETGEIMRTGFNRKVDEFFDKTDVRYQTIAKDFPDITIPPGARQRLEANLNKQQAKAQNLLKTSTNSGEKAQLKEFLDAIQTVRDNSKTYKDFVSSMQSVGRTSFKSIPAGSIVPPDKALFRSLYHDLSGVAMETVSRRVGKKTAEELAKNNKAISEFVNDKSVLGVLSDPKKGVDAAYKVLESGDHVKIAALKRALTPEELQAVKAGFLNTQIKAIEAADGEFTFRMLNNRLRNARNKSTVKALFNPGELDNLKNLVDLGDDFGPKVLSTSGTGASNQINGIVDLVTKPAKAAGAGINKALAVRQEKAAAADLAKKQGAKGGARPLGQGPGMNAVPSVNKIVPPNISDLLKLKPRIRAQAEAYKNLNEDQD